MNSHRGDVCSFLYSTPYEMWDNSWIATSVRIEGNGGELIVKPVLRMVGCLPQKLSKKNQPPDHFVLGVSATTRSCCCRQP
jgi:hypothetical protein